jgi:hypothetical protein
LNYNAAKQIIQSESYLNAADSSIIRRKGTFLDNFEDESLLNNFKDENVFKNFEEYKVFKNLEVGNSFNNFKEENVFKNFEEGINFLDDRQGNLFDISEEEKSVKVWEDRNVEVKFKKGDIAYEVMALFTKQKVNRYCKSELMNEKIDQDTKDVCELYW